MIFSQITGLISYYDLKCFFATLGLSWISEENLFSVVLGLISALVGFDANFVLKSNHLEVARKLSLINQ